MDERSARDLAAIKQREADTVDAIRRADPEISIGAFSPAQVGLRWVYADQWGRLWRDDGNKLTLIFNPEGS